MNADAIKKRLEEYYRTATPDQVLAEFEALGVEFVDIPEIHEIEYQVEQVLPGSFNDDLQSWLDGFLVKPSEENAHCSTDTPINVAANSQQPSSQKSPGNSQYAMAA